MIDLDAALTDLAEHLDHPAGDAIGAAVRTRIAGADDGGRAARSGPRARAVVGIAAAIVALALALVAIGPARHAIADWLGIGAVEVHHSDAPVPVPTATGAHPVPGAVPTSPGSAPAGIAAGQLRTARAAVAFSVVTPRASSSGPLQGVTVDRRVPGGLVALRYRGFTVVEIANAARGPVIGKQAGQVESTTVDGVAGLWIRGAHTIGYLDRNGAFRQDTVRRAGPVLLWARGSVTYRIEGLGRLADARAVARSLHSP